MKSFSVKKTRGGETCIDVYYGKKSGRSAKRLARKIGSLPPNRNSQIGREDKDGVLADAIFSIPDRFLFDRIFRCTVRQTAGGNVVLTILSHKAELMG